MPSMIPKLASTPSPMRQKVNASSRLPQRTQTLPRLATNYVDESKPMINLARSESNSDSSVHIVQPPSIFQSFNNFNPFARSDLQQIHPAPRELQPVSRRTQLAKLYVIQRQSSGLKDAIVVCGRCQHGVVLI
jgi:hypothetical protein